MDQFRSETPPPFEIAARRYKTQLPGFLTSQVVGTPRHNLPALGRGDVARSVMGGGHAQGENHSVDFHSGDFLRSVPDPQAVDRELNRIELGHHVIFQ